MQQGCHSLLILSDQIVLDACIPAGAAANAACMIRATIRCTCLTVLLVNAVEQFPGCVVSLVTHLTSWQCVKTIFWYKCAVALNAHLKCCYKHKRSKQSTLALSTMYCVPSMFHTSSSFSWSSLLSHLHFMCKMIFTSQNCWSVQLETRNELAVPQRDLAHTASAKICQTHIGREVQRMSVFDLFEQ